MALRLVVTDLRVRADGLAEQAAGRTLVLSLLGREDGQPPLASTAINPDNGRSLSALVLPLPTGAEGSEGGQKAATETLEGLRLALSASEEVVCVGVVDGLCAEPGAEGPVAAEMEGALATKLSGYCRCAVSCSVTSPPMPALALRYSIPSNRTELVERTQQWRRVMTGEERGDPPAKPTRALGDASAQRVRAEHTKEREQLAANLQFTRRSASEKPALKPR